MVQIVVSKVNLPPVCKTCRAFGRLSFIILICKEAANKHTVAKAWNPCAANVSAGLISKISKTCPPGHENTFANSIAASFSLPGSSGITDL